MASAASFVVTLIDKVSAPAKRQQKALSALQDQIKKTGKVGAKHHAGAQGLTIKQVAAQNRANLALLANAKISAVAGKAIHGVADGAMSVAKWSAIGAGALGIGLGAALVKNTVQMALFEDTAKTAFKSLTGSAAGGEAAWQSSIGLARELGGGVEDTTNSMKHLLAMQFTLPQAEEMVRMSADLKAVTGDAHSAERALTAITQIKAKGKLQAEELVGQLAEAGVSTTLVYQELQKSMNLKSVGEVQKAITAGAVTADVGIAAIKGAIAHKTHSDTTGAAGRAYSQSTYGGLIGQLKNAPQFLFVRLGEAIAANLEKFKPVVQKLITAIDSIKGDEMTRFVGNALTFMERLVPLTMEFAAGFGEGFGAMNDAMGALDPSKASLETARDLGRAIASGFELAFKAIEKVANMVLWFDQHRGVAATIAGVFAITKLLGVAAAVKTAASVLGIGGAAAATTAAAGAGAAGTVAGAAGAGAAGVGGLAALKAGVLGLGTAGLAAGGAALVGVGAAGASYAYREELANMMLGWFGQRDDQSMTRGLGTASPTPALQGLAGATARANTNNNVRFESHVNIDGSGNDPNAIGRAVSDSQRGMMEQFFQNQALESGAMG
jgi:tape measure domain-containing protein